MLREILSNGPYLMHKSHAHDQVGNEFTITSDASISTNNRGELLENKF